MPVDLTAPRSGILHTEEGQWGGSLQVFEEHFAPHFVVGVDKTSGKTRIAQLVPVGFIGSACRAHNNKAIVQIEMTGFSKEHLWYPSGIVTLDNGKVFDYKDTDKALASLMIAIEKEYGVPLSHPYADDDWGKAGHNPTRSAGKFGKVAGWYGHQNMPDPDTHWDPGAFCWSKLFALAESIKAKK
jgi:hypothetical protein